MRKTIITTIAAAALAGAFAAGYNVGADSKPKATYEAVAGDVYFRAVYPHGFTERQPAFRPPFAD